VVARRAGASAGEFSKRTVTVRARPSSRFIGSPRAACAATNEQSAMTETASRMQQPLASPEAHPS
jgi:hypothetical protein